MATHLFLFIHDGHIRQHKKILCCTKTIVSNKRNIWNFYVKLTLRNKIIWVTKIYLMATKKIMWHPKESSRWLNMFSVTQKTNTCLQKMVPVTYKYMLNWLKKFCVARNIFCCRKNIKDGVLDLTNFFPNCAPYICSLKWLLMWKHWKILRSTSIVKLFVYKTVKCEVTNVKFLGWDLPLNNSTIIVKWRFLKLLCLSKGMCGMGSQLKKWYVSNILETPYTFFSIFSWYLSFTHT